MQQEDQTQNKCADKTDEQPNGTKNLLGVALLGLIHLMPLVLFAVVAVGLINLNRTEWHHPLWMSMIYGIGGALLLIALLAGTGASTLFELGVRCTFILVLLLILFPIFQRVREARRSKQPKTSKHLLHYQSFEQVSYAGTRT